jgi:hypothetical protein
MDESMRSLQQKLDAISKALSLNPTVEGVEAALHRKRNVNQRQDQTTSQGHWSRGPEDSLVRSV